MFKNYKMIVVSIVLISIAGVFSYFAFGNTEDNLLGKLLPSLSRENTQGASAGWTYSNSGWTSTSNAPACPDPLLKPPVDLEQVTGVLYPGQARSGNYKAHGGFRFDTNNTNAIDVKMPIDASLYAGSRYLEKGEEQILLDFIHPCGIMIRFDHLAKVAPKLQTILDQELPPARENDSRTTEFQNVHTFKTGELIATTVGFANPLNTSLDFGVYDLRQKNTKSQADSSWAKNHQQNAKHDYYGVCWLNNFDQNTSEMLKTLPSVTTEGKQSDFCD